MKFTLLFFCLVAAWSISQAYEIDEATADEAVEFLSDSDQGTCPSNHAQSHSNKDEVLPALEIIEFRPLDDEILI